MERKCTKEEEYGGSQIIIVSKIHSAVVVLLQITFTYVALSVLISQELWRPCVCCTLLKTAVSSPLCAGVSRGGEGGQEKSICATVIRVVQRKQCTF